MAATLWRPPMAIRSELSHIKRACLDERLKSFSIFPMSASSPPAILADNLNKTYDRVPAVDALSFRVETGSVVGLLGGNGAGKTTTLAMIMGLTTPTAG
jgi:ABC-type uncharacterized transport system ATPase subunit